MSESTTLPRYVWQLIRLVFSLSTGSSGRPCFAGVPFLARAMKQRSGKAYSEATVRKARAWLRRLGYIEVKRMGPRPAEIRLTAKGRAALERAKLQTAYGPFTIAGRRPREGRSTQSTTLVHAHVREDQNPNNKLPADTGTLPAPPESAAPVVRERRRVAIDPREARIRKALTGQLVRQGVSADRVGAELARASVHSAAAALVYANGYRGGMLNRPGLIVSGLRGAIAFPKWCRQEAETWLANLDDQTTQQETSPSDPTADASGSFEPISGTGHSGAAPSPTRVTGSCPMDSERIRGWIDGGGLTLLQDRRKRQSAPLQIDLAAGELEAREHAASIAAASRWLPEIRRRYGIGGRRTGRCLS